MKSSLRVRTWIGAIVAIALTACSSGAGGGNPLGTGDPTPSPTPTPTPTPTPPPGPASQLDFSAVSGSWTGTVTETQPGGQVFVYETAITLSDSAPRDQQVGTVEYPGFPCGGVLRALSVSGNSYEVSESITHGNGCASGATIRLTHDAQAGTLRYEWTILGGNPQAVADLRRTGG